MREEEQSTRQSASNGVGEDQVALSVPSGCFLHGTLRGGSSGNKRPRLIDYQEAGTGIWGSSVHYSYGAPLPAATDGGLSRPITLLKSHSTRGTTAVAGYARPVTEHTISGGSMWKQWEC